MPFSRCLGWPTLVAGGTIHTARALKLDTTARQIVECTSGDPIIGISQLGQELPPGITGSDSTIAATSGTKNMDFYVRGDWCQIQAVNAFTAGQWWKASTNGQATPHTTGAAFCGGQVTDTCNAAELIHTILDPQYISL